jgi:retinol dehydrogenase-12
LSKETRLDVLVNNAGVMKPPAGSKTAQGYEQQPGTNALGHFLFTEILVPILKTTAASAPVKTVRVNWAGSVGIHMHSPEDGVSFDSSAVAEVFESQDTNYGQFKAASLLMSVNWPAAMLPTVSSAYDSTQEFLRASFSATILECVCF